MTPIIDLPADAHALPRVLFTLGELNLLVVLVKRRQEELRREAERYPDRASSLVDIRCGLDEVEAKLASVVGLI